VSFAPQVDAGYVVQNYRQALDLFFPPGTAILTTTIWHAVPLIFLNTTAQVGHSGI
jgi:hypothetical protein